MFPRAVEFSQSCRQASECARFTESSLQETYVAAFDKLQDTKNFVYTQYMYIMYFGVIFSNIIVVTGRGGVSRTVLREGHRETY